MSKAEEAHIMRIKMLSCSVCDAAGPSDAHHILVGRTPGRRSPDFCTIPLCKLCHQDPKLGIHGLMGMFKIFRVSELDCLASTIEKLYGHK